MLSRGQEIAVAVDDEEATDIVRQWECLTNSDPIAAGVVQF